MQAYAAAVEAHPRAHDLAASLDGVYRFVIQPGGSLAESHRYDLEIRPGDPAGVSASEAGPQPARLEISADYPRWHDLVTGKGDFVMAFLLRRIRIHGDLASVRANLSSARPLLDSLRQVETS